MILLRKFSITEPETGDTAAVLDGKLEGFMEAWLRQAAGEKHAADAE